jgi:hypothetical protein
LTALFVEKSFVKKKVTKLSSVLYLLTFSNTLNRKISAEFFLRFVLNKLTAKIYSLLPWKFHREIHVTLLTTKSGALFSIKHFHNFASRHVLSLASLNQAS